MNLTHTEALPIILVGNTCSIKNIYKICLNLNNGRVHIVRKTDVMDWYTMGSSKLSFIKPIARIKYIMCIYGVVTSKLTKHLYMFWK